MVINMGLVRHEDVCFFADMGSSSWTSMMQTKNARQELLGEGDEDQSKDWRIVKAESIGS